MLYQSAREDILQGFLAKIPTARDWICQNFGNRIYEERENPQSERNADNWKCC